jgi:predicted phage terminase large subunit-like protein
MPNAPAQDLEYFLRHFDKLPPEEQFRAQAMMAAIFEPDDGSAAREKFLPFVRLMWPEFIYGKHHEIMSDAFERIASGDLRRVIINMPPRHTKSQFTSYLFPAWYLGRNPQKKILEASHNLDLAKGWGRQLRNLIASPKYQSVFRGVTLSRDSKATHRWTTVQGGEYFAVGTTGGAAGRGGDLVIIDDPHSEQDVLQNAKVNFTKVWDWYLTGPRQRLQPGAAILVVMTRWGALDLTGQLLKRAIEDPEDGEQWEVIELPAILPSGTGLWPEYWPIAEMLKTKAILPVSRWMAQYQQSPTSEEGALIKREWWRDWTKPDPPQCEYSVQSWDTGYSEDDISNPSACVTWGVFRYKVADDPPSWQTGIILLDSWVGRLNFPELKQQAKRLYEQWMPDCLLVEGRATGKPLVQELCRMGMPVSEFTVGRGKDKFVRTNAVADMFSSGSIWAPLSRRWVDVVREQMAAFPHGEEDDLHDAAVQGLLRIRAGGLIRIATDEQEEDRPPRVIPAYY